MADEVSRTIQNLLGNRGPLLLGAAVVALVLLFMINPFVIVGAGERGVVLTFGSVDETVLDEGLHVKIPFVQTVVLMDVKIQKAQTDAAASTRDLQDTTSTVVVNFRVVPDKANLIYQEVGLSYRDKIIDPGVQEIVKAVTASYNAGELITQRNKVRDEILAALKERMLPYNVVVTDFAIVNFSFSQQFTQAIEDKQTAEQKALKAEQDLKRIEIEAQQKIALARAEAESLRLQRAVISPQVIQLRAIEAKISAIEKWNGQLPRVTGGVIPFINVDEEK
ncbi:MAG: prohibitin family protein [bacterium]|nr:prohibitin family protein [bacterium]